MIIGQFEFRRMSAMRRYGQHFLAAQFYMVSLLDANKMVSEWTFVYHLQSDSLQMDQLQI